MPVSCQEKKGFYQGYPGEGTLADRNHEVKSPPDDLQEVPDGPHPQ